MKNILLLIGFLMVMIGFLSLFLGMTGLQFSYMQWIDSAGRLTGFIARLIIIMLGFLLAFYAKVDWKAEELEIEKESYNVTKN